MPKPIKLTTTGIRTAAVEPGKAETKHPIEGHRGVYLRTRKGSTGKPVLIMYRDASGRQRWIEICGDAMVVKPRDIAEAISIKRGQLAKGNDPAAERKAEAERSRARLEPALDAWERDLERRRVVKRGEYLSLLRRELARPLGNVELAEIDRAIVNERVRKVAASRPGAAKELKTRANVFLGWCVTEGLLIANPLAGWRQPRRTKAEAIERTGRALADWELPVIWRAAEAAGWPFGAYLQMLILLGQRRTETALMAWSQLDLEAGVWTVPASITKSGRAHRGPLPPAAVTILRGLPRAARCDLVFPGRQNRPITGWSKRLPPVYAQTEAAGMAHWTLHDLRRTMRSGLGRLGVDRTIAELLLNHAISDELTAIYDRAEYQQQRADAAGAWADHVVGEVNKVVALRAAN
jgi:integrase